MNSTQAARSAKELLTLERHGTLSTISASQEGFPFGSIVPYDIYPDGSVIIYISLIAEHYRNLQLDPRASLLVAERCGVFNPQAFARATLMMRFQLISPNERSQVEKRYSERFPNSIQYELSHNFVFMRGVPTKIRWIGGFGDIAWVGADEFRKTAFDPICYIGQGIIDHMNQDHQDALLILAQSFRAEQIEHAEAKMCAINGGKFDILLTRGEEYSRVSIPFPQTISTANEARAAMIALLKQAKEQKN